MPVNSRKYIYFYLRILPLLQLLQHSAVGKASIYRGRGKPHKSAIDAKHSVIVLDDFSN